MDSDARGGCWSVHCAGTAFSRPGLGANACRSFKPDCRFASLPSTICGITYPSGSQASYAFDADGRIQTVTLTPVGGSASAAVSSVSYLPFGPVASYTLGNGQTITRTFDANYRLTDLTSPAKQGSAKQGSECTFPAWLDGYA